MRWKARQKLPRPNPRSEWVLNHRGFSFSKFGSAWQRMFIGSEGPMWGSWCAARKCEGCQHWILFEAIYYHGSWVDGWRWHCAGCYAAKLLDNEARLWRNKTDTPQMACAKAIKAHASWIADHY